MGAKTALDPEKDFETPTRAAGLVAENEEESAVRKGFALATFVKPIFERDKDDNAHISYELSLPLTDEHKAWVPDEIGEAWTAVTRHSFKRVDVLNVEPQTVEIMLSPGAPEGGLHLAGCGIEKTSVSTVVEKGTGEEREVTRLHFRVKTDCNNDTARFARVHFGHAVWVKLAATQGRLVKK
jgi:hypothetical protein